MKLLVPVRQVAHLRHLALHTEDCSVRWIEQSIRLTRTTEGFRHPGTPGADEIEQLLTHLGVSRHVSASRLNQALAAVLFLDRDVLRIDRAVLDALRARHTRRLPVLLS